MSKKTPIHREPPSPSKSNSDAFVEAARAIEADEDEKRWEARLKAVVKPRVKPTKKAVKNS